ncbi:NAD(P)-binding protein [Hymenopellis radicata]|nr:NAD(P)-binding protein [Hymenopellis radicata]
MAPVQNSAVIFNEIPTGFPIPGQTMVYDTSHIIDLENVPLNGGILVKTLVVSVDPYLRGKMRDASIESYSLTYLLGQPLYNYGVARVLRSEKHDIKVGDHVTGMIKFQEYYVINDFSTVQVITKTEPSLPWSVYVGAAGMPGRTAYFAYKEYAKAKKGGTIFVSTGAGAVGSMVIQLAKLDGLKVIGSAGTDTKVQYMKEIGADVAFNYKTTDTLEVLKKEGPLDVYWDNVGGSTLDAAIESMKDFGQIIVCGMISAYNDAKGQTYKWNDEFYRVIPKKLASGEIKYKEEITKGLEGAGEAIRKIQAGENLAKSVIVVADE